MEMDQSLLKGIFEKAASSHNKICPRVVLGGRIGLAGAEVMGMEVPRHDKRLLIILETDGWFVSGIEASTGCSVNHRTLRVEDYGKVAGTFVNVKTGVAVRVAPRRGVRERALNYAPEEKKRYFAMLKGYQVMPLDELLTIEDVVLSKPINSIISRAGVRVNCENCSEEIINEREILQDGKVYCQACAGPAYYQTSPNEPIATELIINHGMSSGLGD